MKLERALELAALMFVLGVASAAADEASVDSPGVRVVAEAKGQRNARESRSVKRDAVRRPEAKRVETRKRGDLRKSSSGSARRNAKEQRRGRGELSRRAQTQRRPDGTRPPDARPSRKSPRAGKQKDLRSEKKPLEKQPELPVIVPQAVRVPSYAAVRATIPFSRSEWEADPSYRHNGTMELMLGQLRDMVVYRAPVGPSGMPVGSGVTINNNGAGTRYPGWFGGGFGFGGFEPGVRNGMIQSRGILNPWATQGFIGTSAPVLP